MGKHNIKMKKIISLLIIILLLMGYVSPTYAVGGSYTLDWTAADPAEGKGPYSPTYEKVPPDYLHYDYPMLGRESDPLEDAIFWEPDSASNKDAVESLAPKDLVLGQIVPFELEITVSGDTGPEDGVIHVNQYFNTKTTSGDDFGYDPSYGVIAAFVDTSESHFIDPDGDARVSDLDWTIENEGTSNEEINATITVSGLDDGDLVIVEIWVVLKDYFPDKATGNVQTGLYSAQTDDEDAISVGNQTVPLLKVQEFKANEVDLAVTKDDDIDPIKAGETLTYTIIVTNESEYTAYDVVVVDTIDEGTSYDSGSLEVEGAPFGYTDSFVEPELQITLDSVEAGQTVTITFSVIVDDVEPKTAIDDTEDIPDRTNTVVVTSSNDDTNPDNNTDVEYTGVIDEIPGISIVKTGTFIDGDGDGFADVGETIGYSFEVGNAGNVILTGVTVTDPLVTVSGGPVSLGVGETDTSTFKGTYTITQTDIDAGSVYNKATASGTGGGTIVTATDDHTEPLPQNAMIDLVKNGVFNDEDGDGYADTGETISYSFIVKNIGNLPLTNVTVTDPLFTVIGEPISLAVGQSNASNFSGSYAITQADIDAGSVYNEATADSDESAPDKDDETVELPQNAELNLVKTGYFNDEDGDGYADPGETISYSFEVENVGNVTLTNVTVTDPLFTVAGGPITLGVGAKDNGTFTGTYVITQDDIDEGKVENTATADSDESDPDSDDETVVLPQNAILTLVKTGVFNDEDQDGYADPGETISYSFEVENVGNVTLTNVTVTDPLVTVTGGPIILNVGDKDTTTFTGTYIITQNDIDVGKVDNTATADSDESEPDSDDETVGLSQNAMIDLVKTGTFNDEDGDGYADPGETISYSFEVSNIGLGNVTLTNVTVTDPLVTVTGGPITLNVGEVDTSTFAGTYTITQADIDLGKVENTATADSDESEPDSDDETIMLPQNAELNLVKTGVFNDEDEDGYADSGETISYRFEVENIGNVTLHNVTVTDPLVTVPGGPIILNVGEVDTSTFTGTYIITNDDISDGSVYNTATADSDESEPDSDSETVTLKKKETDNKTYRMEIVKEADADVYTVGDIITYTITVENIGNQTLTDITVKDPMLDFNEIIGRLPSSGDDSVTFTVEYEATEIGTIENTATAIDDRASTVRDDETVVVKDDGDRDNPGLAIEKTIEGEKTEDFVPGDIVEIKLVVTNTGDTKLNNIKVEDLMAGYEHTIEMLSPGESEELLVNMTIEDGMEDFDNIATAEVDNLYAEDSAPVTILEIIEEEEATPLALPEAGMPPMFLFYGLAAIASGLGLTISKKR